MKISDIDYKNSVLVVIDMQKDFVDGALGFKKAEEIYKPICELIKDFKKEDSEVVFTKDTHEEDTYFNTVEGKNLPVLHCVKGSEGWKLYKDLENLIGDSKVIEKDTFGSVELAEYLKLQNKNNIYFCGVVTDICVFSNAVLTRTFCKDARIVVLKDYVASNDENIEAKSFDLLKHLNIEVL